MQNNTAQLQDILAEDNRLFKECNALYHTVAVQFGLSDTAFWLLYALYSAEEPMTQKQLCTEWMLPKQTLNSAVSRMVQMGLLALQPAPGGRNSKYLHLTAEGRALAESTAGAVQRAEIAALQRFDPEQLQLHLSLTRRHLDALREEFSRTAQIAQEMEKL